MAPATYLETAAPPTTPLTACCLIQAQELVSGHPQSIPCDKDRLHAYIERVREAVVRGTLAVTFVLGAYQRSRFRWAHYWCRWFLVLKVQRCTGTSGTSTAVACSVLIDARTRKAHVQGVHEQHRIRWQKRIQREFMSCGSCERSPAMLRTNASVWSMLRMHRLQILLNPRCLLSIPSQLVLFATSISTTTLDSAASVITTTSDATSSDTIIISGR